MRLRTSRSDRFDLGHAGDTVAQDALDSSGEGHGRQRTAAAGTDELQCDLPFGGAEQDEVATVSLEGRTDVLECVFEDLEIDLAVEAGLRLVGWRSNLNDVFLLSGPGNKVTAFVALIGQSSHRCRSSNRILRGRIPDRREDHEASLVIDDNRPRPTRSGSVPRSCGDYLESAGC